MDQLLDSPYIQVDAAGRAHPGLAEEEALIHPGVLAVLRCLELRSAAEIHPFGTHLDDAAVAYVDADPVIGPDAVDGFDFGATIVLHLVIGASGKYLSLDVGALECSSGNRDDCTAPLSGITY